MSGTIDFEYDRENDIIVAVPHWKINTRDDILAWYSQYETYMKKFTRKMDFIVVLDDFEIGAGMGVYWGEYRAKVHQLYTRFNYRVHSNNRVKLFVNTSGVRYNVATEEAATIEDAVEAIMVSRRMAESA